MYVRRPPAALQDLDPAHPSRLPSPPVSPSSVCSTRPGLPFPLVFGSFTLVPPSPSSSSNGSFSPLRSQLPRCPCPAPEASFPPRGCLSCSCILLLYSALLSREILSITCCFATAFLLQVHRMPHKGGFSVCSVVLCASSAWDRTCLLPAVKAFVH